LPNKSKNLIEAKTIKEFQKICAEEKMQKIISKHVNAKEVACNQEVQDIKHKTLK